MATACGGGAKGEQGRERGPCRSDGTCDPGLQCLSKVCVEAQGERCAQVGARVEALLAEEARTKPLLGAALGSMPARVAALVTAACTEDRWSKAAQRCVLEARDHARVEACLADLPPRPRAALARREAALAAGDRVEDDLPPDPRDATDPRFADLGGPPALVHVPDPPPDPPDPDPAPWVTSPSGTDPLGPACEQYVKQLERYARCPSVPAAARRSIAESVTTVRRSFSQVPAQSRKLLEDGCRQGASSMRDALRLLNCP